MAHNQILRVKKLKTDAEVYEALRHDTRQVQPKNADPKLEVHNLHGKGRYPTCKARYTLLMEKLEKPPRKNAVRGIQVFFGASPEWWAEGDDSRGRAYMNSAREWADEKFGKNNIVSFDIHYDEPGSAPHCTVIYAPIVDGKLNAKKLIGGVRWELQRMQDDFHEKVAKPFRLGRGERREPDDPIVRHTELKHFKKWMADEREKIEKEKAALEEEKNALADEKAKTEAERKAMSYNWLGDVFYNLADEEVLEVRNAAQAKADGFRESKVKKPGQITQQRGIPEKRPEVKHRNHA